MVERVAAVWFDWSHGDQFDLLVETNRGVLYAYEETFSRVRVERMVERVREVGMIHIEYWRYVRAAYGSQAWREDGHEARQLEDERAGLG